jgi:hypothetical protein
VGIDAHRRPDNPQPPQPRPPQPDSARHADWHARNDASMTRRPERSAEPRRPERSPDTRQRGTDQQPASRQVPPPDAKRQQPDGRADAGKRPDASGRLSTDYRDWPKAPAVHEQPKLRVVHETRDVNQWRAQPGGPVHLDRVRSDFTKDVKHQAGLQKDSGQAGGLMIDVRLKNVGVGKGSEAVAIQRAMTDVGRKDGVLIRVSVERNGGLCTPGGQQLTPSAPRPPAVQPPPMQPVAPRPPTQPPIYRPDIHHR